MSTLERVSFDEQIARNHRATIFVMAFMLGLLFVVIYAFGIILGTPPTFTFILAGLGAGVYLLVTYNMSLESVIKAADARPVNMEIREEKLFAYRVEEMAIASGLPVPKVYIQESRNINAFASGLKPEASLICITTGALAALDQEELEGVIAHEMSHIANHDIRLATITVGVVGAIAILAEIGVRLLWFGGGRGGRDRGGGNGGAILIVLAIAALILAPIFSRMTYLFLSRKREYLADASGARLTRNPEGLARALEKIRGDMPNDPKGSRTVAGLYIANPFKRQVKGSVWATHPPLTERISRLRKM